jgi:hypothetical protein
MEVLPQLVAEIKRLQAQVESQSESIQILCRDLDPQLRHLMKGKQELREQLVTWQKIAIDERAKYKAIFDQSHGVCHFGGMGTYREQAAEELGLQVTREAGYLVRLEKEYMEIYKWINPDLSDQEAQVALEKIREGAGDDR